tara:strand:+ start:12582 stop:12947 length:366 start_codon:yes stop_codon:yes gene_type:complete
MATRFASSKNAFGFCDRTGFRYPLKDLVYEVRNGVKTGLRVGKDVVDPDHPQNRQGKYPVDDPQALRDPRPDTSFGASGDNSSRGIQWGWNPVGGGNDPFDLTPNDLIGTGHIGNVTVSVS